jgi:hypothetical protein
MPRLLLCCVLLLTTAQARSECDCLWQGSFSEVQAATDLVVSGAIIQGKGNSIDLSVQRLLRGAQPPTAIRIWLQTGDYCRPEAELFPIGSQWVMALHRIDDHVPGGFNPHTPNISYGRIGDYSLSSCGGYWLSQSEDRVSGNLVDAPRWVREPKMTPVLLDLVADFIDGKIDSDALLQASQEDPALRDLMLDTRAFLRGDEQ